MKVKNKKSLLYNYIANRYTEPEPEPEPEPELYYIGNGSSIGTNDIYTLLI